MRNYSTRQRKILRDYLVAHPDEEFTAAEISESLRKDGISLSAVYRNLATLEEEGQVARVSKTGERTVYFRYSGAEECREHIHLFCTGCGKTYHADVTTTDFVADRVASASGFAVDRSQTVLRGLCRDCGKAAEKRKHP